MPHLHRSALDLPVPRTITALMQHMQRLVGREQHRYWCGGALSADKLHAFVHKLEQRYPITRNARERSYDRLRGRAVVHLVMFPTDGTNRTPESRIEWWLLSGLGRGGLADPSMPDAHVAKDALSASGHVVMRDYVLMYATKKEPRSIVDARTGMSRTILKDVSTWTWKLRSEVVKQLRAYIDLHCETLNYGAEPTFGQRDGHGLLGVLADMRSQPLFSGVRSQVIDLHRYARDQWRGRKSAWAARHPMLASQPGIAGGVLPSVADVIAEHLPKMVRLRVYDDPPCRVRDLLPLRARGAVTIHGS